MEVDYEDTESQHPVELKLGHVFPIATLLFGKICPTTPTFLSLTNLTSHGKSCR
jgi:hypothetical protein